MIAPLARRLAFFLIAMATAATGRSDAQEITAVRGRIVDCESAWSYAGKSPVLSMNGARPLVASLAVEDDVGYVRSSRSGADGRFSFLAPLTGRVVVAIERRGYEKRVLSFTAGKGSPVSVTAYLMKIRYVVIASVRPEFVSAGCTAASLARPELDTVDRYSIP